MDFLLNLFGVTPGSPMAVVLAVAVLGVGLVCIVKGGDWFVDAASWMAEASGIPKLIVGATVVSLATSLPEQLTSAIAAGRGEVDMAVGNAIGSVTVNVGLIMAVSILAIPALIGRREYLPKSLCMLAAAALVTVAGFLGEVGVVISLLLVAVFVIFFWENLSAARRSVRSAAQAEERPQVTKKELVKQLALFLLGTAGIVLGSNGLVEGGTALATYAGVDQRIIGVTVIAVGTSLPELVTTLTAIAKKQSALSVGNILGANIIDLTLILPLCSLVSGRSLPLNPTSAILDLPIALVVCLIAVVPALIRGKFSRWQGAVLAVTYTAYLAVTCFVL